MNPAAEPKGTPPAFRDDNAERAVLGSILIDRGVLGDVSSILGESDFFLEPHRRIYRAIIEVSKRGDAIDLVTVKGELSDGKRGLDQAGGPAYLASLIDGIPDTANAADYARRIKQKAAAREVDAITRRVQERVHDGQDWSSAAADGIEQLSAIRETYTPARSRVPSWPTAADWLERLANAGDPIPTHVPVLDLLLRGGMRAGRVCVIGGGPGAGKTALLAQIGHRMAATGASVVLLALDEGPAASSIRLAQHLGISREDAECGVPSAVKKLAVEMGSIRLQLPEPDEVHDFRRIFGEIGAWPEPRVVILDSIQKIHLPDEPENLAQAVEARMEAIKNLARSSKTIVFIASELTRSAGYGRRGQTEDLAAFKNSGGIEYGSDVAIVLRPVEDHEGDVSAAIVKNRIGTKGSFTLRLNPETCLFSEVDAGEPERERMIDNQEKFERLAAKIEKALEPRGTTLSKNQIADKVEGRRQDVYAALPAMERAGRLESEKFGNRYLLWSLPKGVPVRCSPLKGEGTPGTGGTPGVPGTPWEQVGNTRNSYPSGVLS